MNWNDYLYPDTEVLKNKGGYQEQEWLDVYERQRTHDRITEITEKPIKGDYDFKHLKAIHGHVFQDIYEWAGEVREVGISKRHVDFLEPEKINEQANEALDELGDKDLLKGLDHEEFIKEFSNSYGKLNDVHAFREGNGRALQVFMQGIAKNAGYEIDFKAVDKDDWNHACMYNMYDNSENELKKRGGVRKNRELEHIFEHIVKPVDLKQAALMAVAEKMAGQLKSDEDKDKFIQGIKERIALDLEQGRPIPEVGIYDQGASHNAAQIEPVREIEPER